MFQSFPRLTLPAFLQAITVRSALLFFAAFLSVVMLPLIADQLFASSGSSDMNPHVTPYVTFETADFPVSMTHQEPNFYQ